MSFMRTLMKIYTYHCADSADNTHVNTTSMLPQEIFPI